MNFAFIWNTINFLQQPWWTGLAAVTAIFTLFYIIIQDLKSKPPEINLTLVNKNVTQTLLSGPYKEHVIETIESGPEFLYAIVIGPHFLEPDWFIQNRLERNDRKKSFAMALRKYIDDSLNSDDENNKHRKIRLILRNNIRYAHILNEYIEKDQINDLIRGMKYNLHSIFDNSDAKSIIKFHCMDDSGYEQIIVTQKELLIPFREEQNAQIEHGYLIEDEKEIEIKKNNFELIFKHNSTNQDEEITLLDNYISSLESILIGIKDRK